jgi:GalNAc-alpha-(1->4)-GalNAc-alpha-(1->3)-diNAcBac-PP-undecaprenol alpha-1,4-N-acetyl-D-galactosaminyltransferase
MRIAFVISSLGPGGAEKCASIICNAWVEFGHRVTIITFDEDFNKPFYDLEYNIRRIGLGVRGSSSSSWNSLIKNVSTIRHLRNCIKTVNPDCIVSFMDTTNVKTLLATFLLNVPTIVSERTDPARHVIPRVWSFLRRITYVWAKILVVQTTEVRDFFSGIVRKRTLVIPNPIISFGNLYSNNDAKGLRKSRIVGMGRLGPEKRFDLLIRAFALVRQKHDATLIIVGDGPLRNELEDLANKLELDHSVQFTGVIDNSANVLGEADIFALSSEYEGFPNALLEAMACGVAVISFDCPSGPRNIIRHGIDGLLVPPLDVTALAKSMDRLLSNQTERQRLAENARQVCERFSLEKVMQMWGDCLILATSNKPPLHLN